jgi:hypothetical protein
VNVVASKTDIKLKPLSISEKLNTIKKWMAFQMPLA